MLWYKSWLDTRWHFLTGFLVLTLMGFRHGNTSLPMMMRNTARVRFVPAWEGNDYAIAKLPTWLPSNLVLVLVEPYGGDVDSAGSGGVPLKEQYAAAVAARTQPNPPDYLDLMHTAKIERALSVAREVFTA